MVKTCGTPTIANAVPSGIPLGIPPIFKEMADLLERARAIQDAIDAIERARNCDNLTMQFYDSETERNHEVEVPKERLRIAFQSLDSMEADYRKQLAELEAEAKRIARGE